MHERISSVFFLVTAAALTMSGCGGGNEDKVRSEPVTQGSTVRAMAVNTGTMDGYYIDAVAGNDANPGTQAAPWKTLGKAATVKLVSGQAIYLACGQTWRETLSLGAVQLASDTRIAGYGAACATSKAIISGAENLSGSWRKSGNIWVRKVPTTLPKISRLFVNGATLRTAQWPNYGGVGNEYVLASATMAASSQTLLASATDAAQLAGKDLVGATIQVRSKPWYIDQRTVQGYVAGALTLDALTNYPMEAGSGYVLQDKFWMMDAPGEFFHDTVNGMLYVYPQGAAAQANLNGAQVEGAIRDSALLITGVPNVTVSNVRATMTRGDAIAVVNAPGARLEGIEASGNARSGVRIALNSPPAAGVAGATIVNSLLSDNWQYGVDASAASGVYISGSTVMQTGTLGTAGWSHAAIMIGDGGAVSGNTIDQAAYHGIRYSGGGGSVISDNLITNFCVRLTDGAGIYTWNGPKTAPRITGMSSVIRNNRIGSAKANLNGVAGASSPLVIGVYLDDFSQNALVQGNTVFSVPFGIKVHNSANHTIDGNQLWLTTQAGIWASMDQTDADYMTGNVYTGNVVMPYPSVSGTFPRLPDVTAATPYWFTHLMSGAAALSAGRNQFSGNRIIALESGSKPVAIVQGWAGAPSMAMSASAWRGLSPGDLVSAGTVRFAPYNLTLGSELISGGEFSTGLAPLTGWFNVGSAGRVSTVSGVSGCNGPCAQLLSGIAGDQLISANLMMKAGAPHVLRYTAVPLGDATLEVPYLSRSASPWDSMVAAPGFVTQSVASGQTGDVLGYEALFLSSATAANTAARLNLKIRTQGVPVALDAISLRQITAYQLPQPGEVATVIHAPVAAARVVSRCADLGWPTTCQALDPSGAVLTFPRTLRAGSSALFLRGDSIYRR